ncbi:hypothetical protein [Amycolatopsis alkalitolerans]|uniref:Uncharacterized protein n=1 Tax=Amycolatopsis alkalitolerans TaxID=2547244 RepID=A0A5C4M4G2_9PSEU|nr:hypothetical protein [Amycolatopsis alkalitolerans]TNC28006.1 hypothetical protein FG385_06105 [Amycolatopsis alkalitolerans]
MVTGSLIAIAFGLVFVEVNSGGLPAPWALTVRIAGAVAAAGLLLALRGRRRDQDPGTGLGGRRYWTIVLVEAIALFGGLAVINGVFKHGELGVAWTAFVVGVHFFALGKAFRLNRFHLLGAALALLGVAGFVLDARGAGAGTIALVAGVLSGAALFTTVAASLTMAARQAPRSPGR